MIICCAALEAEVERECEDHPHRLDCPDVVIHRADSGDFGIVIHDGGGSVYRITYCPWCGTNLSTLKGTAQPAEEMVA